MRCAFKSFNNQKSFLSGQNLGSFVHNCIERETFDRKSVVVADHNNNSVSDFIENLYTALGIRNNSFYMPNLLLKIFFMIIGKKHVFDKLTEDLNVNMDELVNSHGWTPYETQEIALERIFKDRKLNG